VIAGVVGFWGRSAPRQSDARFLCLTNGVPGNSSLTGLGSVATFTRFHRAMLCWSKAG